jgi:two-component system, LuxR family, sensor kinase FixL
VRFCEVMDAAPVMIWVSGKDKGCIWFNRPWLTFTGRSMAQEVGSGWSDGVHRDDFDGCTKLYSGHFDARKDFRMQYRLRQHDGEYRWVDDTGIPRYARDGTFLGYIGSCVDVDEHRKTQTELRRLLLEIAELNRQRDRVWHHSRDLLGIAGTDGIIRAANPAWTEILGYASDEVIGRNYLDFVFPEDAHLADDAWQTMLSGHNLTDLQIRLRRKDGSARWISWNSRTEGDLFYGYGRDITAAKAQEQALADAERVLRRRLLEIAELNRQADSAMLAASIAHEINQPLTAIVSNSSAALRWLARETPDVENAKATLNNIIHAGKRAAEISHSIRAISNKERHTPPTPVSLNELIREVLALVEAELQSHHIAVQTTLNDALPQMLGDRVQLQQVILNLINNAIEAMKVVSDDSRILQLKTELEDGGNVRITVQDSGPGIDGEDTERIFDRFFTKKSQGMGMGLTICRFIVEAHGGRIWLEAGFQRGSVFLISLPVGSS